MGEAELNAIVSENKDIVNEAQVDKTTIEKLRD